MAVISFLVARFAAAGLPTGLQRLAAWATVVIAVLALLWAGWAILKASIIEDHETERAVKSIDARDDAAEERANDAVRNIIEQQEREAAIAKAALEEARKPESERAQLPPTTLAANCVRMRKAYSEAELAKIKAYQELCK